MLKKLVLLFMFIIFIVSCNSNTVFSEYKNIGNSWNKNEKIEFLFQTPDTINRYNIFINLRNDELYSFSNLFLIANIENSNNETVSDTLEYRMAEANGKWLGEGFSSLKESKLWYKKNYRFPSNGECKITIEHAMRKNGAVEGIYKLNGIRDVGIKIEKISK